MAQPRGADGRFVSLGSLGVTITGDAVQFEKMLAGASKAIQATAAGFERVGAGFSKVLYAPIAAFAGLSVKTATGFEDAMTKSLSVISGVTGKLKGELGKAALNTDDPQKAAEALEVYGRAGYNAEQTLKAFGGAVNFAKANSISFEESISILTKAQTSLGLRSDDATKNMKNQTKLSDMLTQASLQSGASVEQLAKALENRGRTGVKHDANIQKGLELLRAYAHGNLQAGITAKIADERAQSFSEQLQDLKAAIFGVENEVGAMLIPYLKILAGYIRQGITYWKGLSEETKKTAVFIALVVAAIGPFLIGLSYAISLISFASLTFAAWAVAGVAIMAMLALVGDAILQLTGKGNLGLLDMVENFRVGGTKISTWFTAAFLLIWEAWDEVSLKIIVAWKTVVLSVLDLAGEMYRGLVSGAKYAVEAWLKFKHAIHAITTDEFTTQWDAVQKDFNSKIDTSLGAAEARYREYYKSIEDMTKENADRAAYFDGVIQKKFEDDQIAKRQEMEKNRTAGISGGEKVRINEALKAVSLAANTATGPAKGFLLGAQQSLGQASGSGGPGAADLKIPGLNLPAADFSQGAQNLGGKTSGGNGGEAMVVASLRRFQISGPGGLAHAGSKQQEVTDKGVAGKLDVLINETRNQVKTAIMGE